MGHRLSKIYTRTGDSGTTGLGDGSRVPKDCLRVETYGAIDELNSHVGLVLANATRSDLCDCLSAIQHLLFDLGGELAVPGSQKIAQSHIDWLERTLDHFNADLPALKEFVLPGGTAAAAYCHVARTVCRRCERIAVELARSEDVGPYLLSFLNRLSDLLFVFCRVLARENGGREVLWEPNRAMPDFGADS